MKKSISIILPTFNEKENIISLVNSLLKILSGSNLEILIIDDSSTDGTDREVQNRFGNNKKIKLYIRHKDKGLAKSIRYGIDHSEGDFIAVMDTDLNHNPQDLLKMINHIDDFDMVVGSRYISGGGMENKIRFFISFFYNLWIKSFLNLATHDNLSGYFIIKKKSLLKLDFDNIFLGYGDYFIRLLYFSHQKKFKINEVPVYYKNRVYGVSKSNFISMLFDYSKTVLELWKS